jgi:hypothetical protein
LVVEDLLLEGHIDNHLIARLLVSTTLIRVPEPETLVEAIGLFR